MSSFKSRSTRPATCDLICFSTKAGAVFIPDLPSFKEAKTASTPTPIGETIPKPVMTTFFNVISSPAFVI